MKILRTTDKVALKINDVTLVMSPLSQSKKIEVSRLNKVVDGKEVIDGVSMMMFILKHCIKGIDGVEDFSGNKLELKFAEDGSLTDDSVSDMMVVISELQNHYDLVLSVANNKIPSIKNHATGEELSGVEVHIVPKS